MISPLRGAVGPARAWGFVLLVATTPLAGCVAGEGAESATAYDVESSRCSSGFSCANAARDAHDAPTALRLLQRGCDFADDSPDACLALGYAYREGKIDVNYHDVAIPKDPKRAFDVYTKTCPRAAVACELAAELVAKGLVPGEEDASVWQAKACANAQSSDQADPCGAAAKALAARGDTAKANELWTHGCATYRKGCGPAGRAEVAAGKTDAGYEHLKDACFFEKDGDACFDEATLEEKGKDPSKARYTYEDACKYGRDDACARVKDLQASSRARADAEWTAARARDDAEWAARQKERDAEEAREAAREAAEAKKHPGAPAASAPRGGDTSSASKISMHDADANGVHASELTCSLHGGSMLDSFVLLAAVGDRKRALVACGVARGRSFDASWRMRAGAVSGVKVSGSGADACVAKAFGGLKQHSTGDCSGSFSLAP